MIDLKDAPPDIIELQIEQRPDKTVIRYTGTEDGFINAASALRSIPPPRDTTADMMVRTIAILSTLVGVLYLSYGFFRTPFPGAHYETHLCARPVPTR